MSPLWAWVVTAPVLLVLGLVVFNLLTWPRGRARGGRFASLSVLIPARDEASNIRRVLRSIPASEGSEIIVYDDESTDGTPDRVRASDDPRIRLVEGSSLPRGWVGKAHACHRLAEASRGEWLLYVDADVELEPTALERLKDLAETLRADLVSVVPHQRTEGFAERLMLPLLHLAYMAWLPLLLIWRSSDPRFLAANGQVLLIRRAALEAIGGFRAVAGEVVDDMALCRAVKRSGRRVVFADGSEIARCRMYRSAREIFEGFSKNLYEGVGGHPVALLAVVVLHLWVFVAPYALLPVGGGGVLVAGVLANVLLRALLALRFRHAPEGILLHPVAVLGFTLIALNSFWWSARGQIRWRGRSYPVRRERLARIARKEV